MMVHSNKPAASRTNLKLTTTSAAALSALAGGAEALGQAGDAFTLQKAPELISAERAGRGSGDVRVPVQGEVKVDEHMIVDLHVVGEELADVLQMLSIQSQRNIVASRNVAASVTATLYGVTFYEALDAILHVNGFGYIEEGNFIYVYTGDELRKIIESSRQRTTAVIPLDYINSADAAEFAQALLSEKGQIKAPGKTAPFQIPDSAPVGADDLATSAFIVVVDFEENVAAIRDLLAQIDTKPSQVLVEATILQAALTENNAFGVDFSIIGNMNFGDFLGGPLSAVDNLIRGQGENVVGTPTALPSSNNGRASAGNSTVGRTTGPASLKVGYVDGDFAAFLRVLDEVTDTTIIARPKVLTLNRQPARVLVGERVGYLSSTTTQTGTTQTVEFLDTGTQLYFRPFVSRDGLIRMELKPQVSEAVIRNATDSGGSSVTIPDETTNELTANVMVRDGQTIVLGGLFRERTQYTRRQVPWIADLPIIGHAFKGREDSTDRAEIIFMITPTIVNDQIVNEHAERAKSLIDSAVAGTREGLLPFSRDKQASRLLVEAQKYASEGKTKKALYCVRRSLSLNPNQAQARLLLERLSGESRTWPAQSVLQSTFHTEMDLYLDQHGTMGKPSAKASDRDGLAMIAKAENTQSTTSAPAQPQDSTSSESNQDQEALLVEVESTPVASGTSASTDPTPELMTDFETVQSVDPTLALAEETAATQASIDETELAGARAAQAAAQEKPASSESAFAGNDWIGSLAQAEIGAKTAATPTPSSIQTTPEPAVVEPQPAPAPAVAYDADARTFDIAVEDAALPGFLRELSTLSRRSIIVPADATGVVSASLFGLTLEETLEAVLPSQGFGFIEDGKVIRVLTLGAIEAREAAARAASAPQPVTTTAPSPVASNGTPNETPVVPQPVAVVESSTDKASGSSGSVVNAPMSLPSATNLESTTDFELPGVTNMSDPGPAESPLESQIEAAFTDVLLGSLGYTSFDWKPQVSRDGYTEPTSWVGEDAKSQPKG
ncbi:MAG: hypothetical protein KIT54_06905 [Phycisphaeraceae bacterium]|nr:hypothetical protein [Phycisphaeraceae bacterium]